MVQTVYIDIVNLVARAATSGTALPAVTLRIRNDETLQFAFMTSGTQAAVTGWVGGKCVIKQFPAPAPVLLLDSTLAVEGTGGTTTYNAVWNAAQMDGPDGGALRTFLAQPTLPVAGVLARDCWCEVTWTDGNGTHSVSFPIKLQPAFLDPEDEAPDPAESASKAWLVGQLAAGSNVTLSVDATTKVITISAAGGGGGSISTPARAYIESTGNDGTGALGDPTKPFATMQNAYNAGARVFMFGVGSFGGLTGMTQDIMIMGCGVTKTIIGDISGSAGSVYGNGKENVSINSISIVGANGADGPSQATDNGMPGGDGAAGVSTGNVTVSGVKVVGDVVLEAGNGGNGGNGSSTSNGAGFNGGNGGAGGAANTLNIYDSMIGGYAVSLAGAGGNGGNGGTDIANVASGGNGGNGGTGGAPGTVNLYRSHAVNFYAAAATPGSGGSAGTGSAGGAPGSAGFAQSAGTIYLQEFSIGETAPSNMETVTCYQSAMAGTWYN